MHMRASSRLLTLVVVLAIVSGVITSTALVFAQNGTAVAEETPPAPGEGTGQPAQDGDAQQPIVITTDDPTAIELDKTAATAIVIALLGIVLFALWRLIEYLSRSQQSYYAIVREFARKGVYFIPSYASAIAQVLTESPATVSADGTPLPPTTLQQNFRVTGPGFAKAGEAVTVQAFLDGTPAEGTAWMLVRPDGTALPPGAATIQPEVGPTTTFTSSTPGQYQLDVTPPGGTTPAVQTNILVLEEPAKDAAMPSLPFVGQGYGSIIGGLILIALIGALAAIRAIDADIIGVLLGSLAGFFFGVNAAAKA